MFAFLGKESPRVELYGKLPLAKDYLRVGCGEGSGREMREWLDRAFGSARDAHSQPVLATPLRFLGQADGAPLQGCLWPSSDEGGKRLFPFALFVERRRKALLEDLDAALGQAEGLWRELEDVRESCLLCTDGAALLDSLRGRELAVHSVEPVEGGRALLDDWVRTLWPADGQEGLERLLARIRDLAAGERRGPWRLPLVRKLPARDQVLAWTSTLVTLGALEQGHVPTLFYSSDAGLFGGPSLEPAFLVASDAPLQPDEVEWLLAATDDDELGERDLACGLELADDVSHINTEHASSLRDSLRGVLASLRARSSGT